MRDGEEWLMRPVLAGMCTYAELLSSMNLVDIARMNDALDVHQENQYRIAKDRENR